jgi:hypothetical protein
MMADKENSAYWTKLDGHHWLVDAWEAFVVNDESPGLLRWELGSELPEVRQTNHLAIGKRRLAQRMLYALHLPLLLDRTRASWTEEAHPLPIAPETQAMLAQEMLA